MESMNHITQCPICESKASEHFMTTKDYNYTQEEFTITQCTSCGFKYTNPIPTADKIGDYYKADNYISHTSSKKGMFERLYHLVRSYTIKKKFKLVKQYTTGQSLMDIGCGTGDFLGYVKQQGWEVKGLEPSDSAREMAIQNHRLKVESTTELSRQKDVSVDAISMWHVLEHVYDLNPDFEHFKRILKKDGRLFIAVPNCSSHDALYYKEHWAAYDLPIHLYHFTPKDIQQLAEKYDMKVIKILPMKFDSYYVSMLSEKYKRGLDKITLGCMIRGFYRGFVSNMKADTGSYSSQIYILENQINRAD